jgi:putative molybdopterin biosynthesis protein
MDPATGAYNTHLVPPGARLARGWRRLQGLVFRPGDPRFERRDLDAIAGTLGVDPSLVMVNRNTGAGTRVLIDRLLAGARPRGHANQPRSHNAVAAAVARGRADWGVTIATVAKAYGLGFVPIGDEAYDLVVATTPTAATMRVLDTLSSAAFRARLAELGFTPS